MSTTPSSNTSATQTSAIGANTSGTQASTAGVAVAVAPMATGSDVCIRVDNNNQVMLTGNVPSQGDRDRIQQMIQSAVGNQVVVNQLMVGNRR